MKLSRAWVVATNDLGIFRQKKYAFYSLVSFPLVLAIGLPVLFELLLQKEITSTPEIVVLLNASSFLFIILATLLPSALASYSFLGEKVERSLEPLLATPATDGELLLGKSLATLLPCLGVSYAGASIFMVLVDAETYHRLAYYFFPNPTMDAILLLAIPLSCLFSIEASVIIASLVGDLRAAQQLGAVATLPFGGLYVLVVTNFVSLNYTYLVIISVLMLLIDGVLLQVSRLTFRREEILTKWK